MMFILMLIDILDRFNNVLNNVLTSVLNNVLSIKEKNDGKLSFSYILIDQMLTRFARCAKGS